MDVQEAVDLVAPFGKAKAQEAAEAQGLFEEYHIKSHILQTHPHKAA